MPRVRAGERRPAGAERPGGHPGRLAIRDQVAGHEVNRADQSPLRVGDKRHRPAALQRRKGGPGDAAARKLNADDHSGPTAEQIPPRAHPEQRVTQAHDRDRRHRRRTGTRHRRQAWGGRRASRRGRTRGRGAGRPAAEANNGDDRSGHDPGSHQSYQQPRPSAHAEDASHATLRTDLEELPIVRRHIVTVAHAPHHRPVGRDVGMAGKSIRRRRFAPISHSGRIPAPRTHNSREICQRRGDARSPATAPPQQVRRYRSGRLGEAFGF